MESLDVVKHIGLGSIERWVTMTVDALALEHAEEAFTGGVVATVVN